MKNTCAEAKRIFMEAIELADPSDWSEFVSRESGQNSELRSEVNHLLGLHREMGGILVSDPISTHGDCSNEPLDNIIGPYTLLEPIGEGGMGTVYLAEQAKPVRRRVAIKLIKPGMDSKQVIARFEAERQTLAVMDHPNIAKIFDAGNTDAGRPYFVMELVNGLPITEFCDQQKLTTDARLKLFRQVCQAVQHAHQKGIIHRDLKPNNILIAMYDDQPVPKVIDFGVAKAISEPLTENIFLTRFGEVVGTLKYMSPEQAQFNQLDIDTRSDIYSLGAILYELLVGQPPFDDERVKSQAFDETLRMIREEEPTRPSTKLAAANQPSQIAVNRCTTPERLRSTVGGDLDWIVIKAMEKERSRRYETASSLAEDIQRCLDDQPVVACPPSALYRLRKIVRRHKGAIAFASLILFGLLAGLVGLAISNQKIYNEKKLAQLNYRVAMRTLDDLVSHAAEVERMVGLEEWRRSALGSALDYYNEFASQNPGDPDIRNDLLRVREKQASIHLLLENFEEAQTNALSGIELVRADTTGSYDPKILAMIWRRLAEAYDQQGNALQATDAWQHAYDLFLGVTDRRTALQVDDRLELAGFLQSYAQQQMECGDPVLALQSLQIAADHCNQAMTDEPTSQSALFLMVTTNENLAEYYDRGGNESLATIHYREALALADGLSETRTSRQVRARCLWKIGMLLFVDPGETDRAESHYRRAVKIYDQLIEDYPWDVYYRGELAALTHNLAVVVKRQGKIEEARQLLERAATNQSVTIKHKPRNSAHQLFWAKHQWQLANIARDLSQFKQAKTHYESALNHVKRLVMKWGKHRNIRRHQAIFLNDYATMILDEPGAFGNKPRVQLAEEQVRKALEIFETLQNEITELEQLDERAPEIRNYNSSDLRRTYTILARCLNAQGRFDEAITTLKQAKLQIERTPGLHSPKARYQMADALLDVAGTLLMNDEEPVEVERVYREGLAMMIKAHDEDPMVVQKRVYTQELQSHYWGLAQALYEQHQYKESKQEFERSRDLGPMWIEGLRFYADHLLECDDESFRDYRAALECFEEALSRGPKNIGFIGNIKQQIGICHYRLGEFKHAKAVLSDLMVNPEYGSNVNFSIGYYLAMTLEQIDDADDQEGPFHKPEAHKGYDVTLGTHQRLLKEGKLSVEDAAKYEQLRNEAADVIGIQPDDAIPSESCNKRTSCQSHWIADERRTGSLRKTDRSRFPNIILKTIPTTIRERTYHEI